MADMVRAGLFDGLVSITVLNTTEAVREGKRIHDLTPTTSAAFGRSLTIGAILGSSLKEEDHKVSVIIKGDGPLGRMIIDANNKIEVKGTIDHPEVSLPPNEQGKLDVKGAVGTKGTIRVIKDIGLKEPYIGTVELVSGELAEDITQYFFYSEQVPSAVALGVLVDKDGSILAAGGFLAQLLPGHEEEHILYLENILSRFTRGISYEILDTPDVKELLQKIAGDQGYKILSEKEISYHCDCSVEKMQRALISLGKKELTELIEEGEAELICHFCNRKYTFSKEDLEELLKIALANRKIRIIDADTFEQ